jgi:predicted anti-sigma-YlaC factor YlaD
MKACSDYKETLILDAHGELTHEERSSWERHCADCADCRQARDRVRALISTTREAQSAPGLTSREQQYLTDRVERALRRPAPDALPKRVGWVLAPAFAACMVLVVAGWFGLQNFDSPDTVVTHGQRISDEISLTDTELLENMELLQDMEALERLVNLLDKQQQQETSLLEGGSNAEHTYAHV